MAPQENYKKQFFLIKAKDNSFHIIPWNQVTMHRETNKLKLGVEISWSGKNRNERGRGTIVAIGSEEQCKATKKNVEDSSSTTNSPRSSQIICSRKYLTNTATNNKKPDSIAKSSSTNISTNNKTSNSTAKSLSTNTATNNKTPDSTAKSSSANTTKNNKTLDSTAKSTSTNAAKNNKTSNSTAKSLSKNTTTNNITSDLTAKSSSTNISATLISSRTSTSSISSQTPITSTKISNASARRAISMESSSSSDSDCEPALLIDEDFYDKNGVENVFEDGDENDLEDDGKDDLEDGGENDLEDGGENVFEDDGENDDLIETVTKDISISEKDDSSTITTNRNLNEDGEQAIPVATQGKKCRPRDVEKKTVSSSMYNLLLQEKKALEKQIEKYKSRWMPRPSDAKTIKFFIECGLLLSGETDKKQENEKGDKGDTFERYCTLLNLDVDEVDESTSADSITKTCRSLVGKLYSKHERVGKTWKKDVSLDQQRAIFGLARMFHPSEPKTDGELTKACRNVFEVAKSEKKTGKTIPIDNENNNSNKDGDI